jgi:hypothetical protein
MGTRLRDRASLHLAINLEIYWLAQDERLHQTRHSRGWNAPCCG